MTTPNECFKKQVKFNICKAFTVFIEGIILGFPLIVFFLYWLSLPFPDLTMIDDRITFTIIWGNITFIINIIYGWIFAIPCLNCYYGEKL